MEMRRKFKQSRTSESSGSGTNADNKKGLSSETVSSSSSNQPMQTRRHKMQLRLRKMTTIPNESESSSTSVSESEESDDNGVEARDANINPKMSSKSHELETKVSDYFNAQGKSLTSNKNLASIRQDLLDMDLKDILSEIPIEHQTEIKDLSESYKTKFFKWLLYVNNGFNILFYGLGSKRTILDQFRMTLASEYTVVEVKAYLPNVTVDKMLKHILEIVDSNEKHSKLDEVGCIKQHFSDSKREDLCILIHNIDAPSFRNEKAQSILCSLAQCSSVHIVASIDHIRTSLLWDNGKLSDFNWIWEDVTTYLPYTQETAYENSVMVKRTGSLALSSATQVFNSLTPNAKGIFLLIAKKQLEKVESNENYIGMPFQECYSLCRGAFLVNSQLTLNSQLTEFKDHKLLKVKKGSDGGDYLIITLDNNTLSAFVEAQS